jgi:N-acetyl-gamma-glutamyl-phosphate reductase
MKDSLKVAIAGATGYVGLELIKILLKHPKVEIKYLCAQKSIGKSITKSFASIKFKKKENGINLKLKKLPNITKIDKIEWKSIDVLFTALPNGEAQNLAKKIDKNVTLIDLSGDFRIKNQHHYKKWYLKKHYAVGLIKKSIYSLPEFNKKKIKNYKIISCPGCYPTSVQLPLIPLIKKKLINEKNIIIDSKSGYSGAGKKINKKFKFKNLYDSVSAYGVGNHKHVPEIDQELSKVAKKKIKVSFTPHLIPMFRGILSTIYLELNKKVTSKKVYDLLKKYHKDNFFVKIEKFNKSIGTGDVMNTNFCKISVCKDRNNKRIIIISAIDNLIKGASGQAVQNMNILYNFRESTGLV